MGFKQVKKDILTALVHGCYQHEIRNNYIDKNKLQTGEIDVETVIEIIHRSTGNDYSKSSHHQANEIDVHIIKREGWYIKYYLIDDGEMGIFISVHQ